MYNSYIILIFAFDYKVARHNPIRYIRPYSIAIVFCRRLWKCQLRQTVTISQLLCSQIHIINLESNFQMPEISRHTFYSKQFLIGYRLCDSNIADIINTIDVITYIIVIRYCSGAVLLIFIIQCDLSGNCSISCLGVCDVYHRIAVLDIRTVSGDTTYIITASQVRQCITVPDQ